MRNRAKCRLCNSVLESFHAHDFVTCKCGEISIDGGNQYFKASAKNFKNFLRVRDDESAFVPEFIEKNPEEASEGASNKPQEEPPTNPPITTKSELIQIVQEMIKNIENLPQQAQSLPLTHYDYHSILLLFLRFLVADSKRENGLD